MISKSFDETLKLIKDTLAEQLGTEASEINQDDSFTTDLLMKASDLTDFLESLEKKGLESSVIDLNETETVGELAEKLSDEI